MPTLQRIWYSRSLSFIFETFAPILDWVASYYIGYKIYMETIIGIKLWRNFSLLFQVGMECADGWGRELAVPRPAQQRRRSLPRLPCRPRPLSSSAPSHRQSRSHREHRVKAFENQSLLMFDDVADTNIHEFETLVHSNFISWDREAFLAQKESSHNNIIIK